MTQNHRDTDDLVARLRNNQTVHIELAAVCKTYGLDDEAIAGVMSASETDIEAADALEAKQAKIERLQATADISRARLEDKLAELSKMRTGLQAAVRVVEAARRYPQTNIYQPISDAIAAYDKETKP